MYHDFNYQATLASSLRAQWQLDDVLREDQELDFSRNFMPESLARTAALDAPEPVRAAHPQPDQRAPVSVSIFGIVEEFILPFLLDHARPHLARTTTGGSGRSSISPSEEAKHIHLFKRFHQAFVRGFPVECQVIGPSEAKSARKSCVMIRSRSGS